MGKLTRLQNNFAHNILIPVVDKDGALPAYDICRLGIDSQPELGAHHTGHSYWRAHPEFSSWFDNSYRAGKEMAIQEFEGRLLTL
jgi:hypothetical protein